MEEVILFPCTHPTSLFLLTDVSLSSAFIAGFCGETDEEHRDTISLLDTVKFDMAYMFAYSMRKVGRVCEFYHHIISQT